MKILNLLITLSIVSMGLYSDPQKNLNKSKTSVVLKKEYFYFEEGLERKIVLEGGLLAEFGNSNSGKNFSKSEPVQNSQGVKLWDISNSTLSKSFLKGEVVSLNGSLSPVFSENGRLLALPGGVIVQLRQGVNVLTWSSSKGIKSIESIGIPNFYNINTPVGMVSLELANSLKADPNVISATPNFWQESSTR